MQVLRRVLKAAGFAFLGLIVFLAGLSAFFFIAGRDVDLPDLHDLLPPEQLADDMRMRIDAALARWAQMRRKAIERESAFTAERMRNFLSQDRVEMFNRFLQGSYFKPPFDAEDCKWADSFSKGVEWTVRLFPGYGRYAFQPNRALSEWQDTRSKRPLRRAEI